MNQNKYQRALAEYDHVSAKYNKMGVDGKTRSDDCAEFFDRLGKLALIYKHNLNLKLDSSWSDFLQALERQKQANQGEFLKRPLWSGEFDKEKFALEKRKLPNRQNMEGILDILNRQFELKFKKSELMEKWREVLETVILKGRQSSMLTKDGSSVGLKGRHSSMLTDPKLCKFKMN